MAERNTFRGRKWQQVLDGILSKVTKDGVLGKVEKMSTEEDLIRFFMDDHYKDELLNWISSTRAEISWKKCKEKSQSLREDGNRKFQLKDYAQCLNIYNESVICAPNQSEELSLSLANRSAVLLRLKNYEGAVNDIDLAFEHGYPEHLLYKLHQRKGECLVQLRKYQEAITEFGFAQNALEAVQDIALDKKSLIAKSIENAISDASFHLSSNNNSSLIMTSMPELPIPLQGVSEQLACASKTLSIRENKEKGRHVIALCNISIGDILFVEKPFASVLLPEHYQNRCHHCCSLFQAPVPCLECTAALYCSDTCRKNSWSKYHKWECFGGLNIVHSVGIAHLGLRVVLEAGDILEHKALKKRFENNECERNEHYFAVYNLLTHLDIMTAYDRAAYTLTAVCLMLYLHHYTNFFCHDTSPTILKDNVAYDDDSVLIGSRILRHICQLVCNGHAITALQKPKLSDGGDAVVEELQVRVATAIYPSASMMNHSCDPNIINSFFGTHLIVKAYKDIKKGQEVFNCYGPNFRRISKKYRKKMLLAQYHFECQCEACASDYEFLDRFSAFLCGVCDAPLLKQKSKATVVNCNNCGTAYQLSALLADSLRAHYAFKKGCELMDTGYLKEALHSLHTCHEIHVTCLYKSHLERTACLDAIAKCYAMLGDYNNSTMYVQKTLPAVEEQYGLWSIEMGHELQKLTDSMICELNSHRNDHKTFKNKHAEAVKYVKKAKEIFQHHYGLWDPALQEIIKKEENLKAMLMSQNATSY